MPKRHTEEEMPRQTTRSGKRRAKKATEGFPPSSSPFDQENKKYEEELTKAMKISKEELKKGDEEELQ